MLSFQIDTVIPVCSMKQSALVSVQTWDGWPPPVVQNSRGIDQNITVGNELLSCFDILNFYVPTPGRIIPVPACDLMLRFDIALETVFICKRVEIIVNFSTPRIDS